jgi:hypothetical protein
MMSPLLNSTGSRRDETAVDADRGRHANDTTAIKTHLVICRRRWSTNLSERGIVDFGGTVKSLASADRAPYDALVPRPRSSQRSMLKQFSHNNPKRVSL